MREGGERQRKGDRAIEIQGERERDDGDSDSMMERERKTIRKKGRD